MSLLRVGSFSFLAFAAAACAQDVFDHVEEALTISAFDDEVRARLSGTLDLEFYHFDFSAPGLIFTPHDSLFNPRPTLSLDAQLGPRVYLFAQARADRGFDPSDGDAVVRLDEYALRVTPWDDARFSMQVGKFATVVGTWAARHRSWDNPFITAPLPYENLVGIWDSAAAASLRTLLGWAHVSPFLDGEFSDKHLRQPIIWGPSYASGGAVFGRIGKVEYAAELKNAALSSRPESWDATEVQWQHPTVSGRLGFRPSPMWNFGVSASAGTYLRPDAADTVARGHRLGDYRQIVLGQDVGFAWHHWQVWAEFYEARFEIPTIGNADTFAWYVEAKYKFTPRLFGALRWNQQLFNRIDGERWGRELWRIDGALGYRPTAHTQLKLQYSLQHDDEIPGDPGHTVAAQFTVRF